MKNIMTGLFWRMQIGSVMILMCAVCLSFPTKAAVSFTDTAWHKYAESVQFLAERGIVKWYPDWSYGVDKPISRGEILKIILEWVGAWAVEKNLENCFPDAQTEWYAPYICYAKEQAIAKWYPDGTFKPNNNVTIAEWLKMTLNTFEAWVQEWVGDSRADPYIEFVHNNTIFSKYEIFPWALMTRGQMAFLVHKLILNKEGTTTFTNVRMAQSNGCWKPMPAVAPTESMLNAIPRHYITVVGKNYNANIPTKIIFAFHGRTNPNSQVQTYYGIDKASQGDAIVVYPLGLPEEWPTRNWMDGWDKASQLRDFALFDLLLEEFSDAYCINTDEIYVMGHSLGWRFTNALWCFRGDVIRWIGSVWWSPIWNQTCAWPVEAIIMHNPQDNLATFAGGEATRDLFLKTNGCNPASVQPYTSPQSAQCVQYSCGNRGPVVWCPYTDSTERWTYYPHVWPNYAGQLIWDFWKNNK